jgi:hypothetical protein
MDMSDNLPQLRRPAAAAPVSAKSRDESVRIAYSSRSTRIRIV